MNGTEWQSFLIQIISELKSSTNMRRMRFLIQIVLAALVTISIGVSLLFYHAHHAMVEARQYVSDASRLHIGVSGGREFVRIHEKYSRYAEIDSNCTPAECVARFKFDNGVPFNFLFRARSAFLLSNLTLSRDVITSSVIDSVCWGSNGGEYGSQMLESIPNLAVVAPFQEHHHLSSDKVSHISFILTPAASAEQRARAYAFNVRYLGRFSACNDATEMH
jgi:hypothetical protein